MRGGSFTPVAGTSQYQRENKRHGRRNGECPGTSSPATQETQANQEKNYKGKTGRTILIRATMRHDLKYKQFFGLPVTRLDAEVGKEWSLYSIEHHYAS